MSRKYSVEWRIKCDTVGQLRAALADVADDVPVILTAADDAPVVSQSWDISVGTAIDIDASMVDTGLAVGDRVSHVDFPDDPPGIVSGIARDGYVDVGWPDIGYRAYHHEELTPYHNPEEVSA